jgi:hypothetical protein
MDRQRTALRFKVVALHSARNASMGSVHNIEARQRENQLVGVDMGFDREKKLASGLGYAC